MLKRIRCLMYTIAMEFPIFPERARGRKKEVSKIRGINTREYIPYWKPIFMILRSHVHSPPVFFSLSVFCVRFECGYLYYFRIRRPNMIRLSSKYPSIVGFSMELLRILGGSYSVYKLPRWMTDARSGIHIR